MSNKLRTLGVSSWAVLGIVLLLLESVVRLGRISVARLSEGLGAHEWCAFVVCAAAMVYVEGHRTFSRSFGPNVVARAFQLTHSAYWPHVALAPLYAMSLVGDTPRRLVRSWLLAGALVLVVVLVRRLPETIRCIVDASVALALTWGTVALCILFVSRARRELTRAESR